MAAPAFHRLRVRERRSETEDAIVIGFDIPEPLRRLYRFAPGQYLTLRREIAGNELRRSYSICAAAGEMPRVGVRRVADGVFSGWLHDRLRPGDEIDVMTPEGQFGSVLSSARWDANRSHLLAIAAGSGITPILSILRSVLEHQPKARAILLYGNRSSASMMFRQELLDLKDRSMARFALHHVFSREPGESALASGRLDRPRIAQFLDRLIDPTHIEQAFVCGPQGLNEDAESALLAAGVERQRIHVERFGVAPAETRSRGAQPRARPLAEEREPQAQVEVIRDGVRRGFTVLPGDQSILDAASRVGLDLPWSCKSGVCATCRCKLLKGDVRMERQFALQPSDRAAGFVLACQALPLTDRVLLSFDER